VALKRSEVRRLRLFDLEQVRHQQEGQEWVPHWHDEWSFGAIVSGCCRCSVGGRPLVAAAGDLVAIAPGEVHTGALLAREHRAPVLVVMFYVPTAWLDVRQLAAPGRSGRARQPALAREARHLETAEAATDWLARAVPALGQALEAPAQADPPTTPTAAERALLRRLQAAVLAGERSVSGLADRCGVSRERIHRVVTQRLGLSPRDYLRAVRLHRAKNMVMAGEPIAAVAAECGFADQAHFTRWFRRTFGYTPGDLALASAR
jgi:AraC-like DNA-binding protein